MYLPFKEAGLTCEEMQMPWTPHCTVMKLSKANKSNAKPIYKIDKEAYEKHIKIQFGKQTFAGNLSS